MMRIVTLEEHFLIPSLTESVDGCKLDVPWMTPELRDALADLGDRRLKAIFSLRNSAKSATAGGTGGRLV
jgi:hypothetical protein